MLPVFIMMIAINTAIVMQSTLQYCDWIKECAFTVQMVRLPFQIDSLTKTSNFKL